MIAHYRALADYNAWANARLYAAAAGLSAADFRADRGAFFKSVQGTLNHLLVTDRIWMRRFTGEGTAPDRLDVVLFDALADLKEAREREDRRIVAFVGGLGDDGLKGMVRYARASVAETYEQALAPALDHLFNHQTHHRGQVHAILTGLTGSAPSLDLLMFQRDAGIGGTRRLS